MIDGFVSAKKDFNSRVLRISNDDFIYRLENMFILSKFLRDHELGLLVLQKTRIDFKVTLLDKKKYLILK